METARWLIEKKTKLENENKREEKRVGIDSVMIRRNEITKSEAERESQAQKQAESSTTQVRRMLKTKLEFLGEMQNKHKVQSIPLKWWIHNQKRGLEGMENFNERIQRMGPP